ncbi:TPR-like protein [Lenzites betulinus]|nr:TPR-like protein [Lenzites betulinus]
MSSDEDKQATVEQLKAEGDAFHLKGDHAAARSKYTEAIKLDDANAVLYANRAAAYIALKQYLDAGKDAQKAVQIDPTYSKAWARLAKASSELHAWPMSINAWEKALETLPTADLTPQQQQLKARYEEGLEHAKAAKAKREVSAAPEAFNMKAFPKDSEAPWIRAVKLEDVLTANNVLNTSAWAIMNAYKDFSEGVRYMKQLTKADGNFSGNLNAMSLIISGILRDDRVYHMDSPDWLEQLQLQGQIGSITQPFGGWAAGGPETIKEEAVKRLEEKGWKVTRGALAATIRAWFMRAYLAHRTQESLTLALQHYNNIIEVLEWGAELWKDVPISEKGYIFQKTFIRGIRHFKMEAYLGAFTESQSDSDYNVEELIDIANQMVDETTKNVPKDDDDGPMDKGAWYSFFVYPIAEAHATLGAAFMQQGLLAQKASDTEQAETMLAAAAKFYKKAAETYPPDDENAPFYLKIAFEAEWHRGRPLADTLPICERIHKLLPGVMKIWEFSTSSRLLAHLPQLELFEERAYSGLLEGKYTLDTPTSDVPLD